jgi:DNA-binding HxlR family transcriptional regulator
MSQSESSRSSCPVSSALDLIGDRWSLLIARDIALGGKHFFNEFSSSEEGISTNILSDRLRRLEEGGVLVKSADPTDARRSVYTLTEQGLALVPIIVELWVWGAKYRPNSRISDAFQAIVDEDRDSWIGAARDGELSF